MINVQLMMMLKAVICCSKKEIDVFGIDIYMCYIYDHTRIYVTSGKILKCPLENKCLTRSNLLHCSVRKIIAGILFGLV